MYQLSDIYEEKEILGKFETMAEVKTACRQRDLDTDGEWCPLLEKTKIFYEGNVGSERFCNVYNWHY